MSWHVLASPLPVVAWVGLVVLAWLERSRPMAIASGVWLLGIFVGVYGI